MKLEHILLGVLLERPSTGYVLKKFMDTHGRFLRSYTQMSQVYRSLTAMTKRGWVTYSAEVRPGAQDAKIFSVTAEGATVFLDSLTGPYEPPTRFEDPEFGARVAFTGFRSVAQLLTLIATELRARQRQVARFRFRDRHIDYQPTIPFDAALSDAVSERMHQFGAMAIDAQMDKLITLRTWLMSGELSGTGPAADRKPDLAQPAPSTPAPTHPEEQLR